MNAKTLAATRAVLKVAIAITGFIIRNAGTITAAATAVHAWALRAAAKAAEVKVDKAYARYAQAEAAINAAKSEALRQFNAFNATADVALATRTAVREELATLA